jgi:hypothetical protein
MGQPFKFASGGQIPESAQPHGREADGAPLSYARRLFLLTDFEVGLAS